MPTTPGGKFDITQHMVSGVNTSVREVAPGIVAVDATGEISSKDDVARAGVVDAEKSLGLLNSGNSTYEGQTMTRKAEFVHVHNPATTSADGFMSATDKTKLDAAISATTSITLSEEDSIIVKAAKAVVRFVHNGSRSLAHNFKLGATLYVFNGNVSGSASQLNGQVASYYATANAISDMLTQTSAAALYATKSAISDMLTKTDAGNTYATKTAITDMETKTDADNRISTALQPYKVKSLTGSAVTNNGSGAFNVDLREYTDAVEFNIYLDNAIGDDTNNGSINKPVKTINGAFCVCPINVVNLVINISGNYTFIKNETSEYSFPGLLSLKLMFDAINPVYINVDSLSLSKTATTDEYGFPAESKTILFSDIAYIFLFGKKITIGNSSSAEYLRFQNTVVMSFPETLICSNIMFVSASYAGIQPITLRRYIYATNTSYVNVNSLVFDDNASDCGMFSQVGSFLNVTDLAVKTQNVFKISPLFGGYIRLYKTAVIAPSVQTITLMSNGVGTFNDYTVPQIKITNKATKGDVFTFSNNPAAATGIVKPLGLNPTKDQLVGVRVDGSVYYSDGGGGGSSDHIDITSVSTGSILDALKGLLAKGGGDYSLLVYPAVTGMPADNDSWYVQAPLRNPNTMDVTAASCTNDHVYAATFDYRGTLSAWTTPNSSLFNAAFLGKGDTAKDSLSLGGSLANLWAKITDVATAITTALTPYKVKSLTGAGVTDKGGGVFDIPGGGGVGTVKTVNSALPDGSGNINVSGLFSGSTVIPNAQIFCNRNTLSHLSDLNSLKQSGAWWCYKTCSYTNAPVGWSNVVEFILDSILVDDGTVGSNQYLRQMATRPDTGEIQTRYFNRTTWTTWMTSDEVFRDRGRVPLNGDLNNCKLNGFYQGFADSACLNIPNDTFKNVAFVLEVLESTSTGSGSIEQTIRRVDNATKETVEFDRYYIGSAWTPWTPSLMQPLTLPTSDYGQYLTADKTGMHYRWVTPASTAMWAVGDDLVGDAFWAQPFIVLTKDKTLPALDLTKSPYGNYTIIGAPGVGVKHPKILMNSTITWAAASSAKLSFVDCAVYMNADFDTISSGNSKLTIKHTVEGLNNADVPYLVGDISSKSKWRNKGMVSIDSNNFLIGVTVNWDLSNSTDFLLVKGDTNASGFCSVASNGILTLNCSNVFIESHTQSNTTYAYQAVNLSGNLGGSFRGTVYDAFTGNGVLGFHATAGYPALDMNGTSLVTMDWSGEILDSGTQSLFTMGNNLTKFEIDYMENCLMTAGANNANIVTRRGRTVNCVYDFANYTRHLVFVDTIENPSFLNATEAYMTFADLHINTPNAAFTVPVCRKFDCLGGEINALRMYLTTGMSEFHMQDTLVTITESMKVGNIAKGTLINNVIDTGAAAYSVETTDGFVTFAMHNNVTTAPLSLQVGNAFPIGSYFNSCLADDPNSGDVGLKNCIKSIIGGKDWKAIPPCSLTDIYSGLTTNARQKILTDIDDTMSPRVLLARFGPLCVVNAAFSCAPTGAQSKRLVTITLSKDKQDANDLGWGFCNQTTFDQGTSVSYTRWAAANDGLSWMPWAANK